MGTWRPSGNIQVSDNVLGRNVPIVSVNVRTRNWFKWWDWYTDGNGNFQCPKDYYGDLSYSLRWQYPNNRFDIRDGKVGQAFYNGPSQSRSAWNLVISSGLSWFWASIFKAGSFYVGQEPFGLRDKPFDLISIQAMDENGPGDKSAYYKGTNENIRIWRNWSDGSRLTSQELFVITAHELGHAHHDEIYDGSFVLNVESKVKEPWACAMGYYMTSSVYNLPINTSLNWYTRQRWSIGDDEYSPLMIDMVDTYNQRIDNSNDLHDFISGYTLPQIETIIAKGGCKKITDFANEIRALPLPSGITNTILNDYFNQYSGTNSPTYAATTINGGSNFTKGARYYSPNNRFFLVWQSDGNLVLYDTQENPWRDVWTSKSWGRETTHCIMQTDGNLVIYNLNNPNPANNRNVWCTNTWGNTNARLSIEDNGRVVIYASNGTRELWSSTNDNSTLF